MDSKLIYLASPYTHEDQSIVLQRFDAVCHASAKLMKMGVFVYSPIAHTHPVALAGQLPTDWGFWEAYDRRMLASSDELWILTLPGWKDSRGVTGEIKIMKEFRKRIWLLNAEKIKHSNSSYMLSDLDETRHYYIECK